MCPKPSGQGFRPPQNQANDPDPGGWRLLCLPNWGQWTLWPTRLRLYHPKHHLQRRGSLNCSKWWREWMKETRCSRTTGWCQVPRRVRLFWKDQGWRAQNRIAEKEQFKCTLAALRPLPWWRDGGVLHVCGVHHHRTLHQEGQGRSGNCGREPGHPHELQRGVSPGGRPQHQGAVRIWRELLTVAEQLFLFMLSGCLNWTPTPAFYFWYWTSAIFFVFVSKNKLTKGGLAPKDLSTDRVKFFQKPSTPNCRSDISPSTFHNKRLMKILTTSKHGCIVWIRGNDFNNQNMLVVCLWVWLRIRSAQIRARWVFRLQVCQIFQIWIHQ